MPETKLIWLNSDFFQLFPLCIKPGKPLHYLTVPCDPVRALMVGAGLTQGVAGEHVPSECKGHDWKPSHPWLQLEKAFDYASIYVFFTNHHYLPKLSS